MPVTLLGLSSEARRCHRVPASSIAAILSAVQPLGSRRERSRAAGLPALCVSAVLALGGDLLGVRPRSVVLRPDVFAAEPPRAGAWRGPAIPGQPAGPPPARRSPGALSTASAPGGPAGRRRAESDASGYPRAALAPHTARHDEGTGAAGAVFGAGGVVEPRGRRPLQRLRRPLRSLRPMGIPAPAASRLAPPHRFPRGRTPQCPTPGTGCAPRPSERR